MGKSNTKMLQLVLIYCAYQIALVRYVWFFVGKRRIKMYKFLMQTFNEYFNALLATKANKNYNCKPKFAN